jgi:hypothetical protein
MCDMHYSHFYFFLSVRHQQCALGPADVCRKEWITTYGEKWWLRQLRRTDSWPRNDRLRNLWLSRSRSSAGAVWIDTIQILKVF